MTGLDLNAGMLNIARAHDAQGTVQWQEGSAQAMPFPDEVFTLVLCQHGMQYFPDRAAALREMYRVLAPGGRLVLGVWRAIERAPGFFVLSQALGRHISPEAGVLPPFALGDAARLAAEVTGAGFADVTTQLASRLVHYDSPQEFVRTYFISTPLADLLAQVEEAKQTVLLAEVSAALQPYIDDTGLAFPMENQIIWHANSSCWQRSQGAATIQSCRHATERTGMGEEQAHQTERAWLCSCSVVSSFLDLPHLSCSSIVSVRQEGNTERSWGYFFQSIVHRTMREWRMSSQANSHSLLFSVEPGKYARAKIRSGVVKRPSQPLQDPSFDMQESIAKR